LVSCTGIEFCNLAVTETKEVGRRVSRELEERFPNASKNLRVHFSGCPNNCGQNAIGDIGLRGGKTKGPDGQMIEAFDILVGGGTGSQRSFAEVCTRKYPSDTIANAIGNLYQSFTDWCTNGERFYDYVKAHTKEQLDAVARGLPMPPANAAPAAGSDAPADE
jgi:ferredoxin-nitrite reductase